MRNSTSHYVDSLNYEISYTVVFTYRCDLSKGQQALIPEQYRIVIACHVGDSWVILEIIAGTSLRIKTPRGLRQEELLKV